MSKSPSRQSGMSMWAMMFIAAFLGISAIVGLKLFPIYMESYKIDRALTATIEQSGIDEMSRDEIKLSLMRRFDVDDVRRVNNKNWKEHVTIEKKDGKVTIGIAYTAVSPVMGNVSILADFDKRVAN